MYILFVCRTAYGLYYSCTHATEDYNTDGEWTTATLNLAWNIYSCDNSEFLEEKNVYIYSFWPNSLRKISSLHSRDSTSLTHLAATWWWQLCCVFWVSCWASRSCVFSRGVNKKAWWLHIIQVTEAQRRTPPCTFAN